MATGAGRFAVCLVALLGGAISACQGASSGSSGSSGSPVPSPSGPSAQGSTQRHQPAYVAGLTPGRYVAVVFRLMIPAAVGPIQQRFAEAGRQHAQWMMSYAEQHAALPPGSPLPYHPKFGISEAEYQTLTQAYRQMKVHEQERFDLTVTRRGDKLRLAATGKHAFVSKIAISDTGRLQFGDLVVDKPRRAEALAGKFGTWSGYYWAYDPSQQPQRQLNSLEIDLGTVLTSNRRFLRVSRKQSDGKAIIESHDLLCWIDPQPAG